MKQERSTPPPLPPPFNQGDLPLAEEINRVITTCCQFTEDNRQQNHTPQLCNIPRSYNPPAVQNNQHPRNNPSQHNVYLKKLREDTEDELLCYLQADISTAQWTAFESCINKLSKKLLDLQTSKPQQQHPNPSRHYYQRQRQSQRQNQVHNHHRHKASGHQRNTFKLGNYKTSTATSGQKQLDRFYRKQKALAAKYPSAPLKITSNKPTPHNTIWMRPQTFYPLHHQTKWMFWKTLSYLGSQATTKTSACKIGTWSRQNYIPHPKVV